MTLAEGLFIFLIYKRFSFMYADDTTLCSQIDSLRKMESNYFETKINNELSKVIEWHKINQLS